MIEYTQENIEKIAAEIVDAMELDDLCQYVYDDLVALMENSRDTFELNVESLDY